MRLIYMAMCSMLFATGSAWADMNAAEKERLSQATAVLGARATTPEHEIPQDTASRASCVIVIPSLKKAAFIVGEEYGKGVLTCRADQRWSAPAFVQIQEGKEFGTVSNSASR